MTTYEIPVDPAAYSQTLSVELDGATYHLRLVYSERTTAYSLDLASEDGTALFYGRPIVPRFNLLHGTSVEGQLYCLPLRAPETHPQEGELGIGQRCTLVYESP